MTADVTIKNPEKVYMHLYCSAIGYGYNTYYTTHHTENCFNGWNWNTLEHKTFPYPVLQSPFPPNTMMNERVKDRNDLPANVVADRISFITLTKLCPCVSVFA